MKSFLIDTFLHGLAGYYPKQEPAVNVEMHGSGREKRRLTALVNRIAGASPEGRKLLEHAAREGYALALEPMYYSGGTCDAGQRKIVLNSMLSDAWLVGTLAHETRHAYQFSNGGQPTSYMSSRSLGTQIKITRLQEADACAFAAAVVEEMERAGDPVPMKRMGEEKPGITAAYRAAFSAERPESRRNALKAAADAWYDDAEIRFLYEKDTAVLPLSRGKMLENTSGRFETLSSAEIAARICRTDGGLYYDGADLEAPPRAGVHPRTAEWLKKHAESCRNEGAANIDPGLSRLPVYKSSAWLDRRLDETCLGAFPEPFDEEGRAKLLNAGKRKENPFRLKPARAGR